MLVLLLLSHSLFCVCVCLRVLWIWAELHVVNLLTRWPLLWVLCAFVYVCFHVKGGKSERTCSLA